MHAVHQNAVINHGRDELSFLRDETESRTDEWPSVSHSGSWRIARSNCRSMRIH